MKLRVLIICLLFGLTAYAQTKKNEIFVDQNGTMRWHESKEEASFFGVNYTLPFAHAYRATNYLNRDHKEAIDKDVYHFSRLGFNAYRIHVWDVEISDGEGRLLENDHLDLLDYLIAKLRERNIHVLITTMTNFGNGYPERNINTGAFSYLYDKCKVHENEEAIKAQESYINSFIRHKNPYTGLSYIDDPYVVGFEINNEPCHSGTSLQTETYIKRMLAAIKKTGNKKPIFYNVSHNMDHTQAYFNTNIQGGTYQWYPIGLVAGHTRRGNFLPYVDNYHIPFDNIKGFENKAKIVYEFDPADITYSYMYPAMTRSFRAQGFQWITQFAYDPIDLAWANTEYQTHYLNLAYTPKKAISMAIAAEVAYNIPKDKSYPKYPNDTLFGGFRVSYNEDLSEYVSTDKFYYSNNTITRPLNTENITTIKGCGSSPLITYEGTGAYFLDRLENGVWRLEVMPDAVQIRDPFEKASLKKEVVTIVHNPWEMKIVLPDLGGNFSIEAIDKGNLHKGKASEVSVLVKPGVYLLKRANHIPSHNWTPVTKWNEIILGEYVAPKSRTNSFSVVHKAAKTVEANSPLRIEAEIVGPVFPDSVIIYTDKISFWSEKNPYIKMKHSRGYTYIADIPEDEIKEGVFKYNIVVCYGGNKFTSPANVEGGPLDWDYYSSDYWQVQVVQKGAGIRLLNMPEENSILETYAIPETSFVKRAIRSSFNNDYVDYGFFKKDEDALFFWRKYIKDDIINRKESLQKAQFICLNVDNVLGIDKLNVGFVTSNGYTYTSSFSVEKDKMTYRIPLSLLKQSRTALLPAPYPVFLDRYFSPDEAIPFDIKEIEILELFTTDSPSDGANISLQDIWLE